MPRHVRAPLRVTAARACKACYAVMPVFYGHVLLSIEESRNHARNARARARAVVLARARARKPVLCMP